MSFHSTRCQCAAGNDPLARTDILLAGRHPLTRAELREILEQAPTLRVAAEVGSMSSLSSVARALSGSVVVADIGLPGMEDRRALAALTAPVLLVGDGENAERVAGLLSATVRGFICRSSTAAEFVSAVRAVAGGYASLPPVVAGKLLDVVVRDIPPSAQTAPFECLTRREREVLELISRGLTTAEIATELVVQVSTIKSHIYHLLQKLGVKDRTQAVALAYRSGLVRSTEATARLELLVDRPPARLVSA